MTLDASASPRLDKEKLLAARQRFLDHGISIQKWSKARRYDPSIVYRILRGKSVCRWGMYRQIAVELGLVEDELYKPRLLPFENCLDSVPKLTKPKRKKAPRPSRAKTISKEALAAARGRFDEQGIDVGAWAVARRYSPELVEQVLCSSEVSRRGDARRIAVELGLIPSGKIKPRLLPFENCVAPVPPEKRIYKKHPKPSPESVRRGSNSSDRLPSREPQLPSVKRLSQSFRERNPAFEVDLPESPRP